MNGPVLRDIHLPPEPSWWPPALGWWLVAVVAVLLLVLVVRWLMGWRRLARRRRAVLAEFDRALAAARGPREELAALSSLLRRAARVRTPGAAALAGEAWLHFLDGDDPARPFSTGDGRALHEGLYRADGDPPLTPLRALARRRLLELAEAGDA